MSHQLTITLLAFGALQGLLLSLWFFRNHKRHLANIYFALFLLVVGLQLTLKVVSKVYLMDNFYGPYKMSYHLPFLIGPLLYLYIRAHYRNKFQWSDLLHFIPFVAMGVIIFVFGGILKFRALHPITEGTLQFISLAIYVRMALRLNHTQLSQFIKVVAVAETIIIIILPLMRLYYGQFPDVRLLFIVLTLLIYWISYQLISRVDLFLAEEISQISVEFARSTKYAHSTLKSEEADRIEKNLLEIMRKEKLFLDCGLTIDALAGKLNTSRHHLSQVINERLKKTYSDYMNELRLEEVCSRLVDPVNAKYTIAGIALDSGFSSVSGFNDVFKKRFGLTPSKYRDQQLKKMIA